MSWESIKTSGLYIAAVDNKDVKHVILGHTTLNYGVVGVRKYECWPQKLRDVFEDVSRANLTIRKVVDKDQKLVYEFPYAAALTSDIDMQFNLQHLVEDQFNRLKELCRRRRHTCLIRTST